MKTPRERAEAWLKDPNIDEKTKAEVRKLLDHPQELTDAFFTDLAFGTGGLRGVMGAGTNRMNIYTVRKATQGLANYIQKKGRPEKGVVIGFDSRHHSFEFAREAARVLTGNGIKVFFISELRPTPYVSFACRHFNAEAAIMITASHNPKEYNGYKVYWQDGGQIVPPHDSGIIAEVEKATSIHLADFTPPPFDHSLDTAYLDAIAKLQFFPHEKNKNLTISYTSLHGTGITLMPKALQLWGFSPPHLVASQVVPDGDFPTVHFPNPEYPEALKVGTQDLLDNHSDLLIATDPDADRIGLVCLHHNKPRALSGNEQAAIAAYFICDTLTQQKKLPPRGAIVTTIVTTELLKKIAAAYNIGCIEVLTGFKYIGQKIHEWETSHEHNFLFGAEESFGYLIGTAARDKDAIVSGCLFAEIAFQMKQKNFTLIDLLYTIYAQFGLFRERQFSLSFDEGKKGLDAIHTLMHHLRSSPPAHIANLKVTTVQDFLKPGQNLPLADVLLLRLEDQSKVIIRPSGTEPKLKIYLSTEAPCSSDVEKGLGLLDKKLESVLDALKEELV
jgi:phosphomannomutase